MNRRRLRRQLANIPAVIIGLGLGALFISFHTLIRERDGTAVWSIGGLIITAIGLVAMIIQRRVAAKGRNKPTPPK